MKPHIAIVVMILLLVVSCRPTRVITRYEKTDIQTTERDIIVTLRAPAVHLAAQPTIIITEDEDGNQQIHVQPSELETDFCRSVLRMENNRLIHDLFQKDAQLDSLIKGAQKETIKTTITEEPYEVNILTWWQKLWIRIGQILLFALIIVILFYLITK